jgi:hypothetical protein
VIDIGNGGVGGLNAIDQVGPESLSQRQQLRSDKGSPEAVARAGTTKHNTQGKEKETIANIANEENIINSFPPSCTWECYLSKNPDLSKVLPNTYKDALRHYLKHGEKEGRECHCGRTHWCCGLHFFANVGHALSENIADLYNCGPSIFFSSTDASSVKFRQMARVIRHETKIAESRKECYDYYLNNPQDHPKEDRRLAMYSLLARSQRWRYDASKGAHILRYAQEKMLRSCGIAAVPKYREIANSIGEAALQQEGEDNDRDTDRFEQLIDRLPSDSVIIVVRSGMRQLLNPQPILTICTEFNLSCSIFEATKFFSQEDNGSDGFCTVLDHFRYHSGNWEKYKNPLILGNQGAEMFYPLFLGLRIFLVTGNKFGPNDTVDARRIGSNITTLQGETQVANNLIRQNTSNQFDAYFPEFAAMFGANLTAVQSEIDRESVVQARGSGKTQCQKGTFCADLTADLVHVKSKFEKLIKDGELLLRDNGIGAASKE